MDKGNKGMAQRDQELNINMSRKVTIYGTVKITRVVLTAALWEKVALLFPTVSVLCVQVQESTVISKPSVGAKSHLTFSLPARY